MSDVPTARLILDTALVKAVHLRTDTERAWLMIEAVRKAIPMLRRRRPKFVAQAELPPLTPRQKRYARRRRAQGASLNQIMRELKTNIGRVSEAINS